MTGPQIPGPQMPGPQSTHGVRQILASRLLRWVAVLLAMAVAVVACWHDTAYAHGTVSVTLHSDGHGSIWADMAWEDGHPVTEVIVATVAADPLGPGKRVGPVAMAPLDRDGTVRYQGTLATGTWKVTVDAAAPGIGTCSAEFAVGTDAKPRTVSCGRTVRPAAPAAAPADKDSSQTGLWLTVILAVAAAGGLALLMANARRASGHPERSR
jgi:hypothetical protein